jgi:ubiquinone/menaquinone biosynthesis C-methylase UbiE
MIRRLSQVAAAGSVAGIDPSPEMLAQARARNATGVRNGRVDPRRGSVESLPFATNTYDKALAINSMHLWPDRAAGFVDAKVVERDTWFCAMASKP